MWIIYKLKLIIVIYVYNGKNIIDVYSELFTMLAPTEDLEMYLI